MTRWFLGILLFAMLDGVRADVEVLSDDPVALFELPNGSVLTNAYAFRTTSKGMMIMHDGGSYYLNYALLPDEWRTAYCVLDTVEQDISVIAKRDDEYAIYPFLSEISGLSPARLAFFKSVNYEGELDEQLLSVCALQCLLDGAWDDALRLEKKVREKFPETNAVELKTYLVSCPLCGGKGFRTFACKDCNGTGVCPDCGGKGEIPSHFQNAPAKHCTNCRGKGKCLTCAGTGKHLVTCPKCTHGKILDEKSVKKALAEYVNLLNGVLVDEGEE